MSMTNAELIKHLSALPPNETALVEDACSDYRSEIDRIDITPQGGAIIQLTWWEKPGNITTLIPAGENRLYAIPQHGR